MEGKRPEIRFKGYDDEWVSKQFGDAFDFISNNTLSRDNLNNESGVALNVHYGDVLIKFGEYLDVQKEQLPFISDEALVSKFQASLLRDGDVIIADTAEDTTVGKCTEIVCVDGKKIISGLHTMACRPKEKYTLRFLGYCLNSPKYHKNLLPLMQGVKVLSISKSGISDTNIIISENRDEQGKIANFLAALDREIKAELLMCEKLAILKKAMLKKMFPVGERKVPEIRFDGYTDDWEQRKLDTITDVRDGTHDSPQYVETGHPFITSKNVKDGFINYEDIQYVSDKDYEEINKRSKVDKNDILMGMIGTIGNIALVRETPDFAIKNVALIKDIGDVYYRYLYHCLQSNSIAHQLDENLDGGTQKFIALNKIRELVIPVPSEREQHKIGDYMESLDHLITLHQCKLERLKNIKSACIKKMFV